MWCQPTLADICKCKAVRPSRLTARRPKGFITRPSVTLKTLTTITDTIHYASYV